MDNTTMNGIANRKVPKNYDKRIIIIITEAAEEEESENEKISILANRKRKVSSVEMSKEMELIHRY